MPTPVKSTPDLLEKQREEVDRVLASMSFKRAPSLSKFLNFICEMYFDGMSDEIKEYSIAVSALGRRPGFDPQSDPIVRVSAHSLRKRLESYYQGEGSGNPMRITLPVGSYVPSFEVVDTPTASTVGFSGSLSRLESAVATQKVADETSVAGPLERSIAPESAPPAIVREGSGVAWRWIVAVSSIVLICLVGGLYLRGRHNRLPFAESAPVTPSISNAPLFAVSLGVDQQFVDAAGQAWRADSFCHGGSKIKSDAKSIIGASDAKILTAGLSGAFHCSFPVAPGTYEVHLMFADLTGAAVAGHRTSLLVGGRPVVYDIIADAEGTGRAITKVVIDAKPGSDAALHIDSADDNSFLNAVEIYAGTPGRMQPVHLSTAPANYTDATGKAWLSDRYFVGGSQIQRAVITAGATSARLFQWERFGRFRYYLPVVPGKTYTVRLYFSEGYFGRNKLVIGGVGSRVFDVFANGEALLKNFDILAETTPGHEAVIKTFSGIAPFSDGTIELEFQPVHDYALVNAIEVVEE